MNSSNVNLKNKTDILDVLWRHDSVFKAEIARMVNLSQPTVLRIIEDLKKKDIVNVTEIGVSSGGRPPVMLELNKDAYNIISLDIDEYRTEVLLTDLKLNIIDSRIRDNQSADTSLSIMTKAVEMVKSVIEDNRERIREIAGIGVCVPGLVDAKQGYVIYSNELKWSEVSARKFFCQHFDGYITVEEGSRAFAMYEKMFGIGKEIGNYMCLSLGKGISSALVMRGKLIYGASEIAGQIGHMAVEKDGPKCYCGNYGCLELFASGKSIKAKAVETVKGNQNSMITDLVYGEAGKVDLDIVFEAASNGDKTAMDILRNAAEYLGMAVSSVINLVDPEAIICGGKLGNNRLFINMFKEALDNRKMRMRDGEIKLITVENVSSYRAIGAAAFILERFLENGGGVPDSITVK